MTMTLFNKTSFINVGIKKPDVAPELRQCVTRGEALPVVDGSLSDGRRKTHTKLSSVLIH